jgi:hypothetical protein
MGKARPHQKIFPTVVNSMNLIITFWKVKPPKKIKHEWTRFFQGIYDFTKT